MSPRAFILTEHETMVGHLSGEPSAVVLPDWNIGVTGSDVAMSPRQAEQLAYLLCVAADKVRNQ